jgi:hypothetical protein
MLRGRHASWNVKLKREGCGEGTVPRVKTANPAIKRYRSMSGKYGRLAKGQAMKPSLRMSFWMIVALVPRSEALFSQEAPSTGSEAIASTNDKPEGDATENGNAETVAEKRYALFMKQAEQITLESGAGNQRLALRNQPLQTFSSDGNTFGSVFLWKTNDGRPGAIGTIGSLPIANDDFGFTELHWLLPEPMQQVTIGTIAPKAWSVPENAILTQLIPGAPAPAATPQSRLVQMRSLARQFEAQMTNGGARHQLRLLPQPLYRYDDSSAEKDGGIFAYVWTIGTDPELLLHIQSRHDGDRISWYYQPIRFTWRALELSHDHTEVWKAEELLSRDLNRQNGPYITTLTERVD